MATKASRIALAGSNISSTGEVDADTLDNLDNIDFARTSGVSTSFISDSYNILEVRTDNNDDQSSTDGIFKISNGSAGTTKAEFRWDESEDLVHVSYGDHGRHISIASNGNVGINTGSISPSATLDVAGTVTADQYNTDAALPTVRPSLLLDFANSKTLDPRITFTRNSVGTYWDGKTTVKAEENLIPRSDFSSGWETESTVTVNLNNATAPDGTTTALKMNQTSGGSAYYYDYVTIANTGKLTGSVYLKQGTQKYAYVQLITGSTSNRQSILWDLNTGTQIGSHTNGSPTGVSHSITSIGNGWYRCTVTMNQHASGNGYLLIGMADSASPSWGTASVASISGNTSEHIYIWGPQLENRTSATAYTATTAGPIVKYQPKLLTAGIDGPRFDHDPITGESKGLLIEEARTNLKTNSTLASAWTVSSSSSLLQSNTLIAPDGTQTANSMVELPAETVSSAYYAFPVIAGTQYTFSIYLKSSNRRARFEWYYNQTGANWPSATFNLQTGNVDLTNGFDNTFTEDCGNGWYRCGFTVTMVNPLANAGTSYIYMVMDSGSGSNPGHVYTGNSFSSIEYWGAQWEVGSFATSFIKSDGGSSTTRSVDVAVINDVSWYNNSGGTIFGQYTPADTGSWRTVFRIGASNDNNVVLLRVNPGDAKELQGYAFGSKVVDIEGSSSLYTAGAEMKAAAAFQDNDFVTTWDGVQLGTDTSGNVPYDVTKAEIGGALSGGNNINGTVKKIAYYPTRLSNATLQEMTKE